MVSQPMMYQPIAHNTNSWFFFGFGSIELSLGDQESVIYWYFTGRRTSVNWFSLHLSSSGKGKIDFKV